MSAKPSPNAATKAAASTVPQKAAAASTTSGKDNVQEELRKLDTRTRAVNTNNIARVENSQLTSADDKLWVLHSMKTNRPIDRFPVTAKDIAKLTDIELANMLNSLEADRTGTKEQKIEKLRVQIGLKPNPA